MVYCLSVDLKSMVSTGLATIASSNYDLVSAAHGKKTMNILCIGHGGGTLPLFLASKIQGWGCSQFLFCMCFLRRVIDAHITSAAYAFS